MLKVAERQLARGAVNRGAEAQAGEVGLGDGAEETVLAIDSDEMVVVADGFKIHDQRRAALDAQGGRGHKSPLQAVSGALTQSAPRRTGAVRVLVVQPIQKPLNEDRGFERAQGAQLGRCKAQVLERGAASEPDGWLGFAGGQGLRLRERFRSV